MKPSEVFRLSTPTGSSFVPRIVRIAVALLVLGPILFGTEPIPPPYHEYEVQGEIIRPSGGSRANFVITLVGRFSTGGLDGTIELLEGFAHPASTLRGVSDTSGLFWIDVKSPVPADSLQLKVSVLDQAPIYGSYFQVPDDGAPITRDKDISTSSGCDGCGTTDPTSSTIVGYRYLITGLTIVVPY